MRKHLIVLMVILSFGIHAQSQTVKITQEFIERIQKYTELDIFHDGMAAVCRDDSLWGYIKWHLANIQEWEIWLYPTE